MYPQWYCNVHLLFVCLFVCFRASLTFWEMSFTPLYEITVGPAGPSVLGSVSFSTQMCVRLRLITGGTSLPAKGDWPGVGAHSHTEPLHALCVCEGGHCYDVGRWGCKLLVPHVTIFLFEFSGYPEETIALFFTSTSSPHLLALSSLSPDLRKIP